MTKKGSPPGVKLITSALLLAFIAALALARPSFVSQHFEVYDYAGAGESYLRAVADKMESALAAVINRGASLAQPCSGGRYVVNIVRLSGGEMGFTKYSLAVDSAGRVKEACIVWVNLSASLSETMLRAAAYHEIVHVAQASYFRYASVAQSRPWYIEASAEGFGSALSGVCVWAPYYFVYGLYRYNPYRFTGADSRCYALGALYYWVLATGYSGMDAALRGSLSGDNVFSGWVNAAYLDFLLALPKGIMLCGSRYEPEFTRIYLPGGTWSAAVSIDGLSATYYRIELPAPGSVVVVAMGNVRSNILLGQPFITQNTSLLIALVNPGLEPTTANLTVYFRPPLEAKLVKGIYDAWSGSLELTIHVLHAGRPVTGLIEVDGIPVEAYNGYATFKLFGALWGEQVLKVSYAGAEARVRFNVAKPSVSLATHPTLYLASNGWGEIRVVLRNPGSVSVRTEVALESLPFLRSEPVQADVPTGDWSVGLRFNVTSTPAPTTLQVRVCYAPGDCAPLQLSVAPVELKLLQARYDSAANDTFVEALAEPAQLRLTAALKGLQGVAWFKYSTYYVGGITVSLPPPTIELIAQPQLVAPSWLMLLVNATVGFEGVRPAFDAHYTLRVIVNEAELGLVQLRWGDARTLSSLINLTYSGSTLQLAGLFVKPVLLSVPRPVLELESVDWLLEDAGIEVRAGIAVRGPCRFLILGREVSNETLTIERWLERGVGAVEIDLGFETLRLEMPRVELELRVPRIALAGLPVPVTLILQTTAKLNATVIVELGGKEVERLRVVKPGTGKLEAEIVLEPPDPGVYNVAARAWFANASARMIYVRVLGLKVEAPRFTLMGERADMRVHLFAIPSLSLPVNITVAGCGSPLEFALEANSTTSLGFNRVCTAVIEAKFLNFTARAAVQWDVLTLTFEEVLGHHEGGLIVPNGTLKPIALLANGTLAPAKALVNGQPLYVAQRPGGYLLRLEAELWGARNETVLTVYAVLERLYLRAAKLLEELGNPPYLANSLKLAIVSGRWETVGFFVETYSSARHASPEPLALLASTLAEKWAREGDETSLRTAQMLLASRAFIYAAIALGITALIIKRMSRSRPQSEGSEAEEPHREGLAALSAC